MDVATKTLSVVVLVGLVHIMAGMGVIVEPAALLATPFAALSWVSEVTGVHPAFFGLVMISAGGMAINGAMKGTHSYHSTRLAWFVPQEGLLLLQIISISIALIRGRYPDGYPPHGGAWFVLSDQAWAWVLAVSHSAWLAAFISGGAVQRGNTS